MENVQSNKQLLEQLKRNNLYSSIIELKGRNYNHVVMELMKESLEDLKNKKKLANLNSLIKRNKKMGKKLYYSGVNLGMYNIKHNNKGYYITPFLCIEYSQDGFIRIVYQIKEGKDTIKLAKEKLRFLQLDTKVSEVIDTMSLQTTNKVLIK